jgi:hypothetical protein
MFFIDPAVEHPYKLEKVSGKLPADTTLVAATAGADQVLKRGDKVVGKIVGEELGIDRQPYRAIELSEEVGGVKAGRYLIDGNNAVTYFFDKGPTKMDAPKAQLFALIIDGTLGGDLPWGLVLIGVFIAIILELVGVSSLPFAVGLYLNIATSGGIFIGGAVRWMVDRKRKGESAAEAEFSPGMLMASGLIAGGSIAGVLQALISSPGIEDVANWSALDFSSHLPTSLQTNHGWWPMMFFLIMAGSLYYIATQKKKA